MFNILKIKIYALFVDNLVLQMSIKFQVDRIKIIRALLLDELKNAFKRSKSVHLNSKILAAKSCNVENKIFLGTRLLALYF